VVGPAAMQNAEAEIVKAQAAGVDDARMGEVYGRFDPVAINPPYNRKALALQYALRVQKQEKPAEAIKYFKLVPDDDKRLLQARYFQMIATKQVLDSLKPSDPQRGAMLASIQTLADDVNKLAADAI